jgi:hypothetical protein
MTETDRFTWCILLYAAASAVVVTLLLFVYSSDPVVLYIFLMAPIVCLVSFALLVIVIARHKDPGPRASVPRRRTETH